MEDYNLGPCCYTNYNLNVIECSGSDINITWILYIYMHEQKQLKDFYFI